MIVCRICLATNIHKDAIQLQYDVPDKSGGHVDVMFFCLNIQVKNDSKGSKLCLKCYKNVLAFYKFKLLALENDSYFKSLENNEECEVFVDNKVKREKIEDTTCEIKLEHSETELDIKQEYRVPDDNIESDDELLAIIKKQKQKGITEDSKENLSQNAPAKKKRGPKKKPASEKLKICEECGKGVRQLKEHRERHKSKSERKVIKCKLCDKVFATYAACSRHNKFKHQGVREVCSICNKSVCFLKAHMKAMHDPEGLKFPCTECDKKFITPAKLSHHMHVHTKNRPFECDVCPSAFRSKNCLDVHKRAVHEREKAHLCQYCSKSFFKKYHLQLHLRTHTKEKPYKCEECGKSFTTTTILNIHLKRHAGQKTVPCKLCNMMFICSSALTSHMVTHTKIKRHACQFCGVKFYRSDHRLKHERTAHLKHLEFMKAATEEVGSPQR